MGSVGTNLNHAQVAPVGASPVFVDVPGSVSFEQTIATDSTPVLADGLTYLTQYTAPDGSFDLSWLNNSFPVLATINGGTSSSSGTTTTKIDRYVQGGVYVPPPFILADWNANADKVHNPLVAGFRTTIPQATAGIATKTSGQDSVQTWSTSGNFTADDDGQMIIYEELATAPVFTLGVSTVNLTAPAS